MSRVSEFGYVNAKLRARIGVMENSSYLEDMIKAPTLNEAVSSLQNSYFKSVVKVYDNTGDLQMVELALFKLLVNDYKEIASLFKKRREKRFIMSLLEKLEVDNLKIAVRMWYSDVIRHHSLKYRAPYLYREEIVNPIDWDGILNAPNWDKVCEAVKDTEYIEVFSKFTFEEIASKGLFDFEIMLDQEYYKDLFSAVSKLKKKDRTISRNIYDIDCDLKNILLIIRYGYYHELGRKALKEIVFPYGYIYKEITENDVFKNDNPVRNIKSYVRRKYPLVYEELSHIKEAHEDDLTTKEENAKEILKLEKYLQDTRRREYFHLLVENPFSIGIALSYFFISQYQESRIRAILTAKLYSWKEDRIREAIS